jgi:hypothetical protein
MKSFLLLAVDVESNTIKRKIITAEKPRKQSLTPHEDPKKSDVAMPKKMKQIHIVQLNIDSPVVLLMS